jgi:hypothetical protein
MLGGTYTDGSVRKSLSQSLNQWMCPEYQTINKAQKPNNPKKIKLNTEHELLCFTVLGGYAGVAV